MSNYLEFRATFSGFNEIDLKSDSDEKRAFSAVISVKNPTTEVIKVTSETSTFLKWTFAYGLNENQYTIDRFKEPSLPSFHTIEFAPHETKTFPIKIQFEKNWGKNIPNLVASNFNLFCHFPQTNGAIFDVEVKVPTIKFTRIRCYEQQDYFGKDDAKLFCDDKVIWKGKIKKGKEKDINESVTFLTDRKVKLIELDTDPNDLLGEFTIYTNSNYGPAEYDFNLDDAHYKLHYTIE